jgi:hypothetical protein
MQATHISREQMVENWKRKEIAPPPTPVSRPLPRPLNLDHVMDLGNTIYFTFRGRAFGIPPLAWREGERILDVWQTALTFTDLTEPASRKGYYACIRRLQRLVWRNCRPSGPFRRLLRWLHLHRNPFKRATEGEIAELAVFILGRRMKNPALAPETQVPNPEPGT